jgi:hypothetical protein
VDWNIIRQIDAPFVPRLRSITDTSYFPVEDLEQGGADDTAGADASDSSKDLAFLGYASSPSLAPRIDSSHADTPSSASLSPMELSVIVSELSFLQQAYRKSYVIASI